MRPKVTVGIPFYNAETTLLEAIRSVCAQTFTDWELVLFDDGSTDGSLEIARSIRENRVTLQGSKINRGLVHCLNEIAKLAKGHYLARMDADDLMHPKRLGRQVRFLENNPGIPLVGSGAYVLDEAGRPIGIRGRTAPDTTPEGLLKRNTIIHPSLMGRVGWFRDNPYDPAFRRAEDHELWCRTCRETEFGHIAEPLLFNRNAALGQTRKYAESCQADRRIYQKYGPSYIGLLQTARLVAASYAKPLIYRSATRMGLEGRILRIRNSPIGIAERQAANDALADIARTQVPVG